MTLMWDETPTAVRHLEQCQAPNKHFVIATVTGDPEKNQPGCSPRILVARLLPVVTKVLCFPESGSSLQAVLSSSCPPPTPSRPLLPLLCFSHSWDHWLSSAPRKRWVGHPQSQKQKNEESNPHCPSGCADKKYRFFLFCFVWVFFAPFVRDGHHASCFTSISSRYSYHILQV